MSKRYVWAMVFVLLFVLSQGLSLAGPSAAVQVPESDSSPSAPQPPAGSALDTSLTWLAQLGGASRTVALQGDYAFLGVGSRLVVLNVSDMAHPAFVTQTADWLGVVSDVALAGDYAYVAAELAGVRILDISDPTQPTEVGSFTETAANALALQGDLYVADGEAGLQILDISDPTYPSLISTFGDGANDVAVTPSGDVYVAGSTALTALDLSDPAHPLEKGTWPSGCSGVSLPRDGLAFVWTSPSIMYPGTVSLVDVTDPQQMATLGSFEIWPQVHDVAVAGDYAYLASGGLTIYDIRDVAQPENVSYYSTAGAAWRVVLAGGYAYLACERGLQIVSLNDPLNPGLLGQYAMLGAAGAAAADADYVYLASDGLFRVLSLSDPLHPTQVGSCTIGGQPAAIALQGDTAYLAVYAGLQVVDVADARHPRLIDTFEVTARFGNDVAVAGTYAFLGNLDYGFRVYHIGDPNHVRGIGRKEWLAVAIAATEEYAYVAGGNQLAIFSLSDIINLPLVGTCCSGLEVGSDVAVLGSHAYLFADVGLVVLDVSNPASPTETSRFPLPGWSGGAMVVAGRRLVHSGLSGSHNLRVFDLSDPAHPVLQASTRMPAYSGRVAVSGDYIYAPCHDAGLGILHLNIERHAAYLPLVGSGD